MITETNKIPKFAFLLTIVPKLRYLKSRGRIEVWVGFISGI